MGKETPPAPSSPTRPRRRRSVGTGRPKARRFVHPGLTGKNDTLKRMHARWVDPADVVVITDKAHPRWDPRAELDVPEAMTASLMARGCIEPVVVARNGRALEVVDGRLRTLGLRIVNERLRTMGRWPLRLPVVLRDCEDDVEALAVASTANAVRFDDTIFQRAQRAARLVKAGMSQREAAVVLGVHESLLSMYLSMTRLTPALSELAAEGRLPLKAAVELARLPREQQLEAWEEMERRRHEDDQPVAPPPGAAPGTNGASTAKPHRRPATREYFRTGDRARDLARYWVQVDRESLDARFGVLLLYLSHDPETTPEDVVKVFPRLAPFFAAS